MLRRAILPGLVVALLAAAAAQRPALKIGPERLPDAVAGRAYTALLSAAGAKVPLRWSVAGRLPPGLQLDAGSGELRGAPAAAGEARFTIRVTDSSARRAERAYILAIHPPLEVTTARLPKLVRGQRFTARLEAGGGRPPLRWRVAAGTLPPGLELDPASGVLQGVPAQRAPFAFTLEAGDSAQPPQTAQRAFRGEVVGPLQMVWVRAARVDGEEALGSVRVLNHTDDEADLTVLIVAVNESGKAFALGYQRLRIAAHFETPEIPFGSSLPRGRYTVHADAVAEVPERTLIHRDRLQTGVLSIE